MAAAKKRVVRKSVPTRGYSAKGRPSADTMERKAPKRKGMTADQRERMIKGAAGSVGTRSYGSPRKSGQADTISSKKDSALSMAYRRTVPILLSGRRYPRGPFRQTGQTVVSGVTGATAASEKANKSVKQAALAKKKAAGAKTAAKKQNYR